MILAALAPALAFVLLVAVVRPRCPDRRTALLVAAVLWGLLVVATYHMSRVAHWAQNRNVEHYPTPIVRQLFQPPWAEFAILQSYVLTGGARRGVPAVLRGAEMATVARTPSSPALRPLGAGDGDRARPLAGVLSQPREALYFRAHGGLRGPYTGVVKLLAERRCAQIGLHLGSDWEYPLWVLARSVTTGACCPIRPLPSS